VLDIQLGRWADLPERGWHPGNTHIHYDEKETDPDRRLAYDSRVEDLRMTAVSILKRWDLEYATNKYPPGVLNDFTDTHHHVQSGEETRHNSDPFQIGYGHVMLLNIRNQVEPFSRGLLVEGREWRDLYKKEFAWPEALAEATGLSTKDGNGLSFHVRQ